jgi:hypothetical protein
MDDLHDRPRTVWDPEAVRALVRKGAYRLSKTKAEEKILAALRNRRSLLDRFVAEIVNCLDESNHEEQMILQDGRKADAYIPRLPDSMMRSYSLEEGLRHWYVKLTIDDSAVGGIVVLISVHPAQHPPRRLRVLQGGKR